MNGYEIADKLWKRSVFDHVNMFYEVVSQFMNDIGLDKTDEDKILTAIESACNSWDV